ncbi:unnamed protein product, partial [Effrenium voratum]
ALVCLEPKDRLSRILSQPCKCREGICYKQFELGDVKVFMDQFEARGKREQDSILFLASNDQAGTEKKTRKEYYFLGKHLKRQCFETLLGISSHRTDRVGAVDMRFGPRGVKPSHLTASIDAFCIILYNSIAEPLPDRFSYKTAVTF